MPAAGPTDGLPYILEIDNVIRVETRDLKKVSTQHNFMLINSIFPWLSNLIPFIILVQVRNTYLSNHLSSYICDFFENIRLI